MKQFITTNQIKRNSIKLPNELSKNPNLDEAKITVTDDLITFQLPKTQTSLGEIWQYVHHKDSWVVVTLVA